jgi:hypothetical protein
MNNIGICAKHQMNTKRRIRVLIHGLYSFPQFLYVSHSREVGIERTLPIKGYFLGPGGSFRL